MKKIIWLVNQYASSLDYGAGGRCYYFAQGLAAKGYEVYLISSATHHLLRVKPIFDGDIFIEKIENFSYIWLQGVSYKNSHDKKRILNEFDFYLRLLSLRENCNIPKPDVILYSSPSLFAGISALRIARLYGANFILDVRDLWPLTLVNMGISRYHPYVIFLHLIEKYLYKKSDKIISNWPYAIDYMVKHGASKEKFSWIPNGFSSSEFNFSEPLDQNVKKLIPENKFIVGYAGTLGKANSLHTLVEAAYLLKEHEKIHIIVAGDGGLRSDLYNQAVSMNLKNITFINAIKKTQIPSLLKKFDVCYVGFLNNPLYRYGSSLTKLPEYLASGKPIVYASNSKFQPIKKFNAGLTVKPEDAVGVSEAIIQIFNESVDKRQMYGLNGKEAAKTHYEYSSLIEKLISIIHDSEN